MAYQWYPGHMTKTVRQMQEDIRLIDLVIELVDARIPMSSRNPEIAKIASGKARLIVLNKADLSDPDITKKWIAWYEEQGILAEAIDSRSNSAVRSAMLPAIRKACAEKIERNRKKGIKNRPMRCMIVGIPNVGKSTFINSLAGRATAKTGDKPGVTKGKQWIRLNTECDLLDTPGVLWPKIESDRQGENLALIGSIKDDLLEQTDLAARLLARLSELAPEALAQRFGIMQKVNTEESGGGVLPGADIAATGKAPGDCSQILIQIATKRGLLKSGADPDSDRAASLLIREFRAGLLGRISLEIPETKKLQ